MNENKKIGSGRASEIYEGYERKCKYTDNDCRRNTDCCDSSDLPLAIASLPMQCWKLTYMPEKALTIGTMFAELNMPFMGGKCK